MNTWHDDATGLTLAYDDLAPTHSQILLWIHAFPLSRQMWSMAFQQSLVESGYRPICVDLPGFGDSPLAEVPWQIDGLANVLWRFIESLASPQSCIVAGLSMGGYVSLAMARQSPQKLAGLILADTRADADTAEAKAKRNDAITFLESHSTADLLEQMLPRVLAESTLRTKPEVVSEVRRIGNAPSVIATQHALAALRDRHDSMAALSSFPFPTLVIVGENDITTPVAMSEAMKDQLVHGELVVLPKAGHLANLEAPEMFLEAVMNWLNLHSPKKA